MPLLPCPSINPSHFCTVGDVKIDDSVAIAPGVILQADPHCQIVIRAGVCIGMGTILHAHQGNLEIQAGAILGAGVLVVGKGTIGANACIGSTTTVLNADIAPERVISPGSVVGKIGREVPLDQQEQQVVTTIATTELAIIAASIETLTPALTSATPTPSTFVPPVPPAPAPSTFIAPKPLALVNSTFVDPNPSNGFSNSMTNSNNSQNSNSFGSQNLPISQKNPANSSEASETKPKEESSGIPEAGTENIHQFYGKNRLDRLLGTLMPQNKPLA